MDTLQLKSVNWEYGMLLTPEHFLRQERYLESLFSWGLSYLSDGAGLVGGGVRLPATELGAVRHDPIVVLDETQDGLGITVSQCRGITPAGLLVDVDPRGAISERFPKDNLAGVAEATVYLVAEAGEKLATDAAADAYNPQMKAARSFRYRIALDVTAAERMQAMAVSRIRRPIAGVHYEKDGAFIPPCLSMAAHSELTAGWRRIVEQIAGLASSYAELHRAMREFLVLFLERGIETEVDRDSIQFAERMVQTLQDTAYAVLDRSQPPVRFFGELRKLLHKAAMFFDLAPGMQQYYETLRETGETELIALVQAQRHAVQGGRTLELDADLGVELRSVRQSLTALEKLERALEGKYIDFRKSPSLEGTNFVFDRGGKVLYRLAARPARVQGVVDELTIYFSQLRLEGRDRYRLVLVGDRNAPYVRGTSISVEIRLNEGSGFRREAIILTTEVRLDEQFNVEFDFEAPDVPTITDMRVTVPAYHAIRTALLFIRHRFYAGRTADTAPAQARAQEPVFESLPFSSVSGVAMREEPVLAGNGRAAPQSGAPAASRLSPASPDPSPVAAETSGEAMPPWSPRPRDPAAQPYPEEPAARPRRRRLE